VRALLVAAVAVAALVVTAPAGAKESYCSPTGDYCTSAAKIKGVRYLKIATFSFTGRVKICVKDPTAARVCHSFKLLKAGPLYQAKVLWKRNYQNAGAGTYTVTFFWTGTKLGPALSFRVAWPI
jgi:hypothetical protein